MLQDCHPAQVLSLRTGHLRYVVKLYRSRVQGGLQHRRDVEKEQELGPGSAGSRDLPGLRCGLRSFQLHLLAAVSPVRE